MTDKLKIIKYIVFLLTFLLVFGSLVLLGTIFKLVRNSGDEPAMPEKIFLGEPEGSSIRSMIGSGDNLYFLIKDGGKSDRVIVFNPEKAQKISEIKLN